MDVNVVTISNAEYKELVLKAYKYDKLRATCVAGRYASIEEEIVFDITDAEKKEMEERSNN